MALAPLLIQPWAARLVIALSQVLHQSKAAAQRRRLAEREEKVAGQLSFSD
jgi:hypothetical protein